MKALKKILLGVLAFVLVIVIFSLFLSRKVYVERSLIIKAPKEVVFAQINTIKNWEKWSPWHRLDPKMQLTYFGPESGAGAGYSWKSDQKNVGNGKLTISASGGDSILNLMEFGGQSPALAGYRFAKQDSGVKVTWYLQSDMGMNPIGKIFGLFMDKMIGPDFEKGLHNLDSVSQAEAKKTSAAPAPCKIEMGSWDGMQILTAHRVCKADSIGFMLGSAYGEIGMAAKKQGLKQAGSVMAIYNTFTMEKVDFEAAVPTDKAGKSDGGVIAKELPKCDVAVADYYGPYNEGMHAAHQQLHDFIKAQGKEISGAPWEVYVGDPGIEKDWTKILTKIYYPVK
jgi:effector-binding domain-containing protein